MLVITHAYELNISSVRLGRSNGRPSYLWVAPSFIDSASPEN